MTEKEFNFPFVRKEYKKMKKEFNCKECGKKVTTNEKHTYKDCLKYKKEFNLSEKIKKHDEKSEPFVYRRDIKEAVRLLKEELCECNFLEYHKCALCMVLNKIFGEKLSK